MCPPIFFPQPIKDLTKPTSIEDVNFTFNDRLFYFIRTKQRFIRCKFSRTYKNSRSGEIICPFCLLKLDRSEFTKIKEIRSHSLEYIRETRDIRCIKCNVNCVLYRQIEDCPLCNHAYIIFFQGLNTISIKQLYLHYLREFTVAQLQLDEAPLDISRALTFIRQGLDYIESVEYRSRHRESYILNPTTRGSASPR